LETVLNLETHLEKHNVHPTKSQEKWQIRLDKEIVKEDRHIIYSIPFTTLISTKLQAFQYKINLRILFTNERLMKCNLSETEMCSFCFETRESLVHLFFHCLHVQNQFFLQYLIYSTQSFHTGI
jgi:hypothetical protein